MSDASVPPISGADALLARVDDIHDDAPERALELLRELAPAELPPGRLPLLAFLVNHVLGEKLGLWTEALSHQRAIVEAAGRAPSTAVARQAAIAAQVAGDAASAREWSQALATLAGTPLSKARALVTLGAVTFSATTLDAETAGRLSLQALQPLAAIHAAPGNGLDEGFGAVTSNLASALLERPLDDLEQPDLRTALELAAEHSQRFWQRAGQWLQHERAHYLRAMAANALGRGPVAAAQARAGLDILDAQDAASRQAVDRSFLELELALALGLAGLPGADEAQGRALALSESFDDASLHAWFARRRGRNETLAAYYRAP